MDERYCSQCDIEMKKTAITAEGIGDLYIKTDREDGILKRLGLDDNTPLDAFLCPECGLTQLYADFAD